MRRIKNRTKKGQVECRCTNKDEVEMAKKKKKNSAKYSPFRLLVIKLTTQGEVSLVFATNQNCKIASIPKARS